MANDKPNGSRTNGTETGKVGPGKPPVEHQFKPGNPGRPKGARNKLGEAFLEDLLTAWTDKGIEAIQRVIIERPQDFLKVVASILPKEITAEISHRFVARMPAPAETTDEWQKQHSPTQTTIQ